MTIAQAQAKLDIARQAGLISPDEARWFEKMIRRTGGYGNKWSWTEQKAKRAKLMEHFA